jgi:hypothetical protein
MDLVVETPTFEPVAQAFTDCLLFAAAWPINYKGTSSVDKIKQAIHDLKIAIIQIERCNEFVA